MTAYPSRFKDLPWKFTRANKRLPKINDRLISGYDIDDDGSYSDYDVTTILGFQDAVQGDYETYSEWKVSNGGTIDYFEGKDFFKNGLWYFIEKNRKPSGFSEFIRRIEAKDKVENVSVEPKKKRKTPKKKKIEETSVTEYTDYVEYIYGEFT